MMDLFSAIVVIPTLCLAERHPRMLHVPTMVLTNGMQTLLSVFQVCLKTCLHSLFKVFVILTNDKVLLSTTNIQVKLKNY